MAVGSLVAVYAYEVAPRQVGPYAGGTVRPTAQLQAALDSTFERTKIASAPAVTFEVDSSSPARTHPIRDAALTLGFSQDVAARRAAAEGLAARLASAMDNRSKPSLLMVSVHVVPAVHERRVLLWTFPQQEVFNLRSTQGQTSLEILEAFNRESNLRKVALIQGPDTKSGMLTARVLDFQANSNQKTVADFWIVRFLAARLQMSDSEGTQILARALRSAHTRTRGDQRAQDQIIAAISALRVTNVARWSIDSVASKFMDGDAAAALISAVRPEERTAIFGVDPQRLDHLIQYKRFTLGSGVVVSAPFATVDSGGGIEVSEVGGARWLRAEGEIQEEQVRSRV